MHTYIKAFQISLCHFFMICAFAHSFGQFLPDTHYHIEYGQEQMKNDSVFDLFLPKKNAAIRQRKRRKMERNTIFYEALETAGLKAQYDGHVKKLFQPFQLSEAEEGIQHLDLHEQPELCWKRDGGI